MRNNRLGRVIFLVVIAALAAVVAMPIASFVTRNDTLVNGSNQEGNIDVKPQRIGGFTASPRSAGEPTPFKRLHLPDVAAHDAPRDPEELDKLYPGFRAAYEKTNDAARLRLNKQKRRCLAAVPKGISEVRWETVETFTPSDDGQRLGRTGIDVTTESLTLRPFADCLTSAMQADHSHVTIEVPDNSSFDGSFALRNEYLTLFNQMSPEELQAEITTLRERAAELKATDDRRLLIEDQIELFECYLANGLEHRRECLSR